MDWEGMLEFVDPDVEQHGTVGLASGGGHVSRGVDEIRQRFEAENIEVWEEHRIEPVRLIDAGERVVVIQHEYQRGKGSGMENRDRHIPSSTFVMAASLASSRT